MWLRCAAGRAKPTEDAALRRLFIDMERLRVVFAGESLDRLGLELVRAKDRGDADAEEFAKRVMRRPTCQNMPVFSICTASPR
jgi:hypothetical protein